MKIIFEKNLSFNIKKLKNDYENFFIELVFDFLIRLSALDNEDAILIVNNSNVSVTSNSKGSVLVFRTDNFEVNEKFDKFIMKTELVFNETLKDLSFFMNGVDVNNSYEELKNLFLEKSVENFNKDKKLEDKTFLTLENNKSKKIFVFENDFLSYMMNDFFNLEFKEDIEFQRFSKMYYYNVGTQNLNGKLVFMYENSKIFISDVIEKKAAEFIDVLVPKMSFELDEIVKRNLKESQLNKESYDVFLKYYELFKNEKIQKEFSDVLLENVSSKKIKI